jgi:hypothetical protein
MANPEDRGSKPDQENRRPGAQNEEAFPEMTDDIRGREADDDVDIDRDSDRDEETEETEFVEDEDEY